MPTEARYMAEPKLITHHAVVQLATVGTLVAFLVVHVILVQHLILVHARLQLLRIAAVIKDVIVATI